MTKLKVLVLACNKVNALHGNILKDVALRSLVSINDSDFKVNFLVDLVSKK